MTKLLDIQGLSVTFPSASGRFAAVDDVSLSVEEGEVLGIVGESGSGKSVTMLALMGLIPPPAEIRADRLAFAGQNLAGMPPRLRRRLTGKDVAMIFQDPIGSLNPSFTIGFQLAEVLRAHGGLSGKALRRRAIALLEQVGIPAPESRLGAFPHQLSGGMNQRAMIAMAIACNPRLLIADEPTTALDVTVQAQILDLLLALRQERGMALVLISHNMSVVAETAQRVVVMYAGQVVEQQPAARMFAAPRHPYAAALLAALPERSAGAARLPTVPGVVPGQADRPAGCLFHPRCSQADDRCRAERPGLRSSGEGDVRCHYPLTAAPHAGAVGRGGAEPEPPAGDAVAVAAGLTRHYPVRQGLFARPSMLKALDGVSFTLRPGRTLAVVGESGCGKSTLARLVTLVDKPTAGTLRIAGMDAVRPRPAERATLRRAVHTVFQNPYGSLNPRKTVGAIIEEPLAVNTGLGRSERRDSAREMMRRVGLRPEHYGRYPHMFSGGQRQRIAIARALMLRPKLVVADEPVSALDVSIQAQVLNLLKDLQEEFGLSYLFISHDLAVVRHIAHDILVMYLGRGVEQGPAREVFGRPLHPYTRALLAATPGLAAGAGRRALGGELPSPLDPPPGCAFSTRCPHVVARCRVEPPVMRDLVGRQVACHEAERFIDASSPPSNRTPPCDE